MIRSYMDNGVQVHTRIGQLFNCMTQRAKIGGSFQRRWPRYEGTTASEEFLNFETFTAWATSQLGWDDPDFELDKDILSVGSRHYSSETCVFIPRIINVNVARHKRKAVKSEKRGFVIYAKLSGCSVIIGPHSTEAECSLDYEDLKQLYLEELLDKFKHKMSKRAVDAVEKWIAENFPK